MKQQKLSYFLVKKKVFSKDPIYARKEISFEIKLAARLLLDESLYSGNKLRLEQKINDAIDKNNRTDFNTLSKMYQPFTWE